MNNNQTQNNTTTNGNAQPKVNGEQAKFRELVTNNLGILPNGVTIDINSDLVIRALTNLLEEQGVEGVGEYVYITATYNQQFDRVINQKASPKEAIDPFNFYCVLDLSRTGQVTKKPKNGKKNSFVKEDNGLSRALQSLSNLAVNTSDKAEFEIQGNRELHAVLGELVRDGRVKWTYAKNRKVATTKLDTGLVLNYLLDVPVNAKYVLDILRAKQHKNRKFSATILKTAATKNYNSTKFNPMNFVR